MNFELEFPYEDDTIYLAYSRPYPYSQIIAHMFNIETFLTNPVLRLPSQSPTSATSLPDKTVATESIKKFSLKLVNQAFIYDRSLLCRTICGLPVPLVSITANAKSTQANPGVIPLSKR